MEKSNNNGYIKYNIRELVLQKVEGLLQKLIL